MLYFTSLMGDIAKASIESSAVNVGVRLRYAFYSTVADNQFSVFVAYNSTTSLEAPGFQIGTKDETSTSIMVNGTGSIHPFVLATRVQYFAQVDMQGRIAVLTLRTRDYAGPILAIQPGQGTAEIPIRHHGRRDARRGDRGNRGRPLRAVTELLRNSRRDHLSLA